jgi:glucose-1-phosphate adenylyltransferase
VLVEVLEELHRELGHGAGEGDSGLGDYGEHLLPRLVERGRTVVHAMPGYWKDLGQPHKYLAAHRDALTSDLGFLDDEGWPILSHQQHRPAARVLDGARVADSLLSPGSEVQGTVERSVIGPGVRVAAGAVVRDSVLFDGTVVEAGARVDLAIVDRDCVVERGSGVGEEGADPADPDAIVLVGRGSRVTPGARVPAGARLEPGTTA